MYSILGLDLAAKEKNPSGIFYYNGKINMSILYKNSEIIDLIENERFDIIVIDAPLSFKLPYRNSEKLLYDKGFRPLPLSLDSMKELYKRASYIRSLFNNLKFIETFPRATEKILKLNFRNLKDTFKSKHIYDAWLCYLTGIYYKLNKYEDLDGIIIPKV